MSNELSDLVIWPGSQKKKFRVGRGIGSGNGKTAGRGTKGQKSRSGSSLRPGFEGGQMPIQRRLPKRGFTNIFAVTVDIVNLWQLEDFSPQQVVDVDALVGRGLVSGKNPVKILGQGELTHSVNVVANAFSSGAIAKITAIGGKAEVVG